MLLIGRFGQFLAHAARCRQMRLSVAVPGTYAEREYCHEYDKSPDHGRCGRRLRDAGRQDGLEMRLRKTQQADPYVWATGEDAVAHRWVRQNYPRMNLQNWLP